MVVVIFVVMGVFCFVAVVGVASGVVVCFVYSTLRFLWTVVCFLYSTLKKKNFVIIVVHYYLVDPLKI